jgi:hypothetical protein
MESTATEQALNVSDLCLKDRNGMYFFVKDRLVGLSRAVLLVIGGKLALNSTLKTIT